MAITARPDHLIEASFFNSDDGPVWSNLSDDIELQEGIKVGKRRQTVFDDVAPATLSATFDNSTGKYNNDRTDSPFFGLVNLDVPIRMRLRWPGSPSGTSNMLGDVQSVGGSGAVFWAGQGSLDSETASPPAGTPSDLIWSTGLLDQTGVGVYVGSNPPRVPADSPVYVKPNTTYSARVQVKCDTAGTGISFAVKARLRWFDIAGNLISDSDSASAVTLTTAYQAVTVSATSPANAHSVRLGIVSQTKVQPGTRSITFDGGDTKTQHWGKSQDITIPASVDVGDFMNVFVRTNDTSVTVSAPTGWTFVQSWNDSRGKTSWWYKVASHHDPNKRLTWTTDSKSHFQVMLTTWTGVDQTTLIHRSAVATETTFRNTHTTPSVTTTLANCLIVSAVFDISSTTRSWTPPAGEKIRNVSYSTGGNAPTGIVTDTGTQVAAGTYGSKVFTSNVGARHASMVTFALAPAAGTGPSNVNVQLGAWELVTGSLGTWQQGGQWATKFTGLADSWEQVFNGDLVMMSVSATDRQKILNTIPVESALHETIMINSPVAYYKLNETSPSTQGVQEAANTSDILQEPLTQKRWGTGYKNSDVINWGGGRGPVADGSPAVVLTPVNALKGVGLQTDLTHPLRRADGITLVCWWSSNLTISDTGPCPILWLQDGAKGSAQRGYFAITGPGPGLSLAADAVINSEGTRVQATASKTDTTFWDNNFHCLVATATFDSGNLVVTLYVDGNQVAQATSATSMAQFPTLSQLSVGSYPTANLSVNVARGTYSQAAVFDWCLDADTIADIYTAGTTAFAGETVDQRINRIATWTGQASLNVDATGTKLDRHMPDSTTALAAFQQAARSEGGVLYIGGNGEIVFKSRWQKISAPLPLITVTANQVDPGAFTKITDDTLLINRPAVNRLGKNAKTWLNDKKSVALYGIYKRDFDTILDTHDAAVNYATFILSLYSEPQPRCNQVTIRPTAIQNWSSVILADIWDVLVINGMPSTEASSSLELFIEGWEMDIDQDNWTVIYDTSSTLPYAILNDPVRGVCGPSVVAW